MKKWGEIKSDLHINACHCSGWSPDVAWMKVGCVVNVGACGRRMEFSVWELLSH